MDQTTTTKRKKVVTEVTLAPELQIRVAEIAEERDWSLAQTGGHLIKLGLEKWDEQQIPITKPQRDLLPAQR